MSYPVQYSINHAAPHHYSTDHSEVFLGHTQDHLHNITSRFPDVLAVHQYPATALDWSSSTSTHGRGGCQNYPYPMSNKSSLAANTVGPIRSHHDRKSAQFHTTRRKSASTVSRPNGSQGQYRPPDDPSLPGTPVLQNEPSPAFKFYACLYRPIVFNQIFGSSRVEPYARVDAVLSTPANCNLLCPDDRVMKDLPERRIKIKLLWPGYSRFPHTKTIDTDRGQATRFEVFERVAVAVVEFFKKMEANCSYRDIDRGYEEWTIIRRRDGTRGIIFGDVVITSLVHQSGAEWQVELRVL